MPLLVWQGSWLVRSYALEMVGTSLQRRLMHEYRNWKGPRYAQHFEPDEKSTVEQHDGDIATDREEQDGKVYNPQRRAIREYNFGPTGTLQSFLVKLVDYDRYSNQANIYVVDQAFGNIAFLTRVQLQGSQGGLVESIVVGRDQASKKELLFLYEPTSGSGTFHFLDSATGEIRPQSTTTHSLEPNCNRLVRLPGVGTGGNFLLQKDGDVFIYQVDFTSGGPQEGWAIKTRITNMARQVLPAKESACAAFFTFYGNMILTLRFDPPTFGLYNVNDTNLSLTQWAVAPESELHAERSGYFYINTLEVFGPQDFWVPSARYIATVVPAIGRGLDLYSPAERHLANGMYDVNFFHRLFLPCEEFHPTDCCFAGGIW